MRCELSCEFAVPPKSKCFMCPLSRMEVKKRRMFASVQFAHVQARSQEFPVWLWLPVWVKRGAWKLYPFHSLCHLTQVGLKAWMQHVASHVYQTVSTTCFVDVIAVYSQKLSWMNAFNRSENCNVDSDLTLMSYCVFSCVSYRLTGVALEKAK